MAEMIRVKIGDQVKEYEKGCTFLSIVKEFQKDISDDIVLVKVDGRLVELFKKLDTECTVEFVTTRDNIGHETYRRSLTFLMIKAVYDVVGENVLEKVRIHYSISAGYYCAILGDVVVDEVLIGTIRDRMKELIALDLPLTKKSLRTANAIELFKRHKMFDKERLFNYRLASSVNIYSINEFEDYFYGFMVPSTGYVPYFELHLYGEGFVVQMPQQNNPKVVPPFNPPEKLFGVLQESTKWGDQQGIPTVGYLNDKITRQEGSIEDLICVQEARQEYQIAEIAETIVGRSEVKIILVAGPSSSGKTTFSHRLSVQLNAQGLKPHPIAVDNYFVDREKTPKDEDGNYNFECIEAIDVESFSKDISDLLAGKEVIIPSFDFVLGRRKYTNPPIKLDEHDVLVIEGIHCLNPALTKAFPDNRKYKIFISALTQLNIDEHNRIPSSDGRLIRRMVRDARTRGAGAQRTIEMWPSVRRGEGEYIFPFQEEADVMFNSALIYELAVLKQYVEPLLFGIPRGSEEYLEARRLLKFLDYFVGIKSDVIPRTSLLREFIGGGIFRV